MNKYLKVAAVVIIIVLVFCLSFFASAKESVEAISYDEYEKLIKGEAFIYFGSEDEKEVLKSFADKNDIEISILNPDELSKSEIKASGLKEGNIYLYKKGEEVYKYSGNISESDLTKDFMEEGLIAKEYISITLDEYLDIIKKDGYHLMFIGSDTCSYCDMFKESINESLKDNSYNVYYLNIQDVPQEQISKLYETDSYFTEEQWGTPLTFLYKDGKRVEVLNGYVETSELNKFLKENKVI